MDNALSKFLVRTSLREIARLEAGVSPESYLTVGERVRAHYYSHQISPNQAEVIFAALDEEVPDYDPEQTIEGLTLQDVSDAVADLSEVVSEIIDPESEESEVE